MLCRNIYTEHKVCLQILYTLPDSTLEMLRSGQWVDRGPVKDETLQRRWAVRADSGDWWSLAQRDPGILPVLHTALCSCVCLALPFWLPERVASVQFHRLSDWFTLHFSKYDAFFPPFFFLSVWTAGTCTQGYFSLQMKTSRYVELNMASDILLVGKKYDFHMIRRRKRYAHMLLTYRSLWR